MADLSYRIDGLETVIREIERRRLNARRSIRQILTPGANIVRDAIKQRGKGRFRTQITRRISLNMARLQAAAEIGPVKRVAYIGRFLEFGTRPHLIRGRRGKMLRLHGRRFVRQVQHPGTAPQPFLQPGYDASKTRAITAIADAAKKVLGV